MTLQPVVGVPTAVHLAHTISVRMLSLRSAITPRRVLSSPAGVNVHQQVGAIALLILIIAIDGTEHQLLL